MSRWWLLWLLSIAYGPYHAANAAGGAVPASMDSVALQERANLGSMPYRAFAPSAEAGQKLPLLVFLHGVGERGSDNAAQVSYEFFRQAKGLFGTDTLKLHPAFVIAPQAPLTDRWINTPNWQQPVVRQVSPTPALAAVWAIINEFVKQHPVDRSRVYLLGLSMGGYGVYDLVSRHPDSFAAAVVVCGGGDPHFAHILARTPFYIAHGGLDNVVPPTMSQAMVTALTQAGAPPQYAEYPDLGHNSWDRAFTDPRLIQWLFQQKRRTASNFP